MNTKNDIITAIYKDNYIKKLSVAFSNKLGNYREDFEQYMYELILNIPDNKLDKLYEDLELYFYIYYCAKAQAFNPNSDFNKIHRGRLDVEFSLDNENYTEKQFNEED